MKNKLKDIDEAKERLKQIIGKHLEGFVQIPTFETIEKDFYAIDTLGSAWIMLNISTSTTFDKGCEFDEEVPKGWSKNRYLDVTDKLISMVASEHERENDAEELGKITWELCSRRCLVNYLRRVIHWGMISILSASYISSMVLLRSAFELLIGIATRKEGTMSHRISSIDFLSSSEKRSLKRLWKEMCKWAHPYKKWIRKTCPMFIAQKPMYHPTACKDSIEKLEQLIDLLLVLTIEKFKVPKSHIKTKAKKSKVDLSNYPFLSRRF